MKTEQQVDALMATIPEKFRQRWCASIEPGGGGCACMGCVQICNRAVMVERLTGIKFHGDPEYIDERKIPADVYAECKISRQEWEAWMVRNKTAD